MLQIRAGKDFEITWLDAHVLRMQSLKPGQESDSSQERGATRSTWDLTQLPHS